MLLQLHRVLLVAALVVVGKLVAVDADFFTSHHALSVALVGRFVAANPTPAPLDEGSQRFIDTANNAYNWVFTLYRVPQWDYWSLADCQASRDALAKNEDAAIRLVYRNFLRAARTDMQTMAIAVQLNKYESATKLSDYFPTPADYCDPGEPCTPEDRFAAAGVQKLFVEGALNLLFPTSFFQMALDLLKFACNGNRFRARDLRNPETISSGPLSPFAEFISSRFPELYRKFRKLSIPTAIWRLRGGLTAAEFDPNVDFGGFGFSGRFQFWKPDDSPYLEPIGGFPLAVLRAANKVIQVLQKAARTLSKLFNAAGVDVASNAFGFIDRSLNLPKGSLGKLEDGLDGKLCQKSRTLSVDGTKKFTLDVPTSVQFLLFFLRVLDILRLLVEVTSNVMTTIVSRIDSRSLNKRFAELLELSGTSCEIQKYTVPNFRDPGQNFSTVIDFFNERISDADSWIVEVDDLQTNSGRRTEEDGFDEALANFEQFNNGTLSLFHAFESVVEKLKETYLDIGLEKLELAFAGFPNLLESITNEIAKVIKPFEDAASFLSGIVDKVSSIQFPPFPFGLLSFLIDEVVNPILEKFGIPTLDDIVDWIGDKIGIDIDIPDINYDPFGELLDSIIGQFDFDLDVGLNLTGLVQGFPIEFEGFFDLSTFLNATFGLWKGIQTTPGDAYDDFHDILGLQLGGNVTSISNRLIDETVLTIDCGETNRTPVMAQATFSSGVCEESLTGLLRFPCEEGLSSCQVNITNLLRVCAIPEPDDLFNEHLGLPSYYVRARYICLSNISDYKIVPLLIDGDSTVKVEPLPTLDFNNFVPAFDGSNVNMSDYSDLFIRRGYEVTDVTSTPMNCSKFDRKVFVYKRKHIDPCVNGFSFPYTLQSSRQNMTDLCGYKVLFDHKEVFNCGGDTTVADAQRTSGFASLEFAEPRFKQLCWIDDNTSSEPMNVSWKVLASNIERCELSRNNVRACPFFGHYGLKKRSDIGSTVEQCSGSPFCPYVYDGNDGIEACNDATFNFAAQTFGQDPNGWNLVDCVARETAEETLEYSSNLGLPVGLAYEPPPNRSSWNPYDAWLAEFNSLELQCGDAFTPEGTIRDECNGKPICNMAETGCLPAEWVYACVSHRDLEAGLTRLYLWDDGDTDFRPQIQCPIQNIIVNGNETEVKQYIDIHQVLEANPDDISKWIDITATVSDSCMAGFDKLKNVCDMAPGNIARFPRDGNVWEIDYECKCPGGFDVEPVDGVCQVCAAGQYRPGLRIEAVEVFNRTDFVSFVSDITDCTPCPPGSYASEEGSEECIPCELGFATSDYGSTECKACPLGTHSENNETTGSMSCDYCEAGEYQDEEGQFECKLVAAGYSQPDEGEVVQLICPSGTFSSEGDAECTSCGPGFFASREGTADSCSPCEPGSYAVTTGSSECRLCEQGFYTDEFQATRCKQCGEGLTTEAQGAKNASQCVPSFDAAFLQTRLEAGSSSDYNVDEMEDLPPNGLANRTVTQVSVGCRRFLIDYTPGVTNETVELYLQQIGNGFCSSALNVEVCKWDGGDCCPQTCKVLPLEGYNSSDFENDPELFDDWKLSGSCFWGSFECRDPDALATEVETAECNTQRERKRRGLSEDISNSRQAFLEAFEARRSEYYARRRLDANDTEADLLGNGVCDPELNNPENIFDNGDCCPQTCRTNNEFRSQSCTDLSFLVPYGQSCETGYGCCDPLVLNATSFEETDISPPVIEIVPDYMVEYNRSVDYSVTLGSGVSPYPPVVKDNDECFNPDRGVNLTVEEVARIGSRALGVGNILCGGPIERFRFNYTATDDAGNIGSSVMSAILVDTEAPDFVCPSGVTLMSSADGNVELPKWTASDTGQGDVGVSFTTDDSNLAIVNNTLSGLPSTAMGVTLMAHANDGCGNVASCQFSAMITRTESPSTMPSSIPSAMPSMQPSVTLEFPLKLSSIKGSAAKFFSSDKKKLKVYIMSTEMYNVGLIDETSLRCGVTGNETIPLEIDKDKDENDDGLEDWEVTFQANELGFGDNLLGSGAEEDNLFDTNSTGAGVNDDYITIIVTGSVQGLGRFVASEQLYIGTGSKKSKSDKSAKKSSKASAERRLRG